MTTWCEFAAAAPALAARGVERFSATRVVMLGTLRRDGRPRVSPVEPLIVDGELYLGMMWQSRKALDLLRDPRCVVHSSVSDASGAEGEFKLSGRCRAADGAAEREAYGRALFEVTGWRPSGDYHLFAVAVEEVAWVRLGGGPREVLLWVPGGPVVSRTPPAEPE